MPFKSIESYPFTDEDWRRVGAVYGIQDKDRKPIYVGRTGNLRKRMAAHVAEKSHCMYRHSPALVVAEIIETKLERRDREAELIVELKPPCNQVGKALDHLQKNAPSRLAPPKLG